VQLTNTLSESFKVKRIGFDDQHMFFCLFNFVFPAIDRMHVGEYLHTCGAFFFHESMRQTKSGCGVRAATKHAQREIFCFG